jgi:hypothetical protein
MNLQNIDKMARDLGAPVAPGALPAGVFIGWLPIAVDLGTAVSAGADVQNLRTQGNVLNPQAVKVGWNTSSPDLILSVYSARLRLGGAAADALDDGDLAGLNGSLYLRWQNIGGDNVYSPLAGGIATSRVATQRTQGTAADGSFGATPRVRAVQVLPTARVRMRDKEFALYGSAPVPTFAGGADLDQCTLELFASLVPAGAVNLRSDCDRVLSPQVLEQFKARIPPSAAT